MGKHGPCYHCGVTSTPLWRNGPPEKPVLCNACGSRWRTKGSLANYTPLHARDELDDLRLNKTISITNKNKEPELLKRKLTNDEDTSNRSSCGSAISNSNSNYAPQSGSDFTSCPNAWDPVVPSRKRSCVTRLKPSPSPVEVLTKDLYTLWYQQQSSCLSASSEEDLLLQTHNKPIGHGSLLIRHPNSLLTEEESEASSLSVDNNQYNSFNSLHPAAYSCTRLNKKNAHSSALLEQTTRDKDQVVKLPILAHHNSPLCYIDLQDIVNFEMFSNYLTNDEQQQLMKLLPSVDILDAPYSLKSLFSSSEFNLNLSSFQKLIAEGVFDNSFGGVNTEDCRILKKLVLCDLAKSKWVEQHTAFKDLKCESSIKSEVVGGYNGFEFVTGANLKRSRDGHNQKYTGSRVSMKSPSRVMTISSFGEKELIDKDESFLSGRSLFSIQNDNELLIDVPSNGSFPQAELLPSSSYGSSSLYPNLVHP